jgi:tetratricopeptide (TPR) repeat protein
MKNIFDKNNRNGFIAILIFLGIVVFIFYWRTNVEETPGDYNVKKGNYRLEDGQYERAVEEFNTALNKNPDHIQAHLGLAVTYMQLGRYEEAIKYFNRAIEIDPTLAVAYADRGILYDRMGKYSLALRDYKRALELEPEISKGPGWLWRFLHNVKEKPPTIADRAAYIEAELKKPAEERLLSVPELDRKQKMYKY